MLRRLCTTLIFGLLGAFPANAFEECRFAFELDTQSSAFQALVEGAQERGGFWRPIHEAPDDVRDIAKYIGRLDFCLRTADGKPAQVTRGGRTQEISSPFVTSCTAALLSDNRLLTNVHCYYDPGFVAAGFTIVDQVRINFGYTSKDMVASVKTFPVANREITLNKPLDAMVLQVLGDANEALGGHVPMVMETDPRPRRALTMIHHPKGDPQQFSSGTCQIHPRQSEIPEDASQLRHSCETTGGSSGSLLLDARTLAVVALHNTGGLSRQGGFNGGHKIAMIEEALDIGFTSTAAPVPVKPVGNPANDALLAALLLSDDAKKRGALEILIQQFPDSLAAQSAQQTLAALIAVTPTAKPSDPGLLIVAEDGSGQFTSTTEAIAAAPDGARIEVRPGGYTGAAVVDKSLTIIGIGQSGEVNWELMDGEPILWKKGTGEISNIAFYGHEGHVLRVVDGRLHIEGGSIGNFTKSAIHVEGTANVTLKDIDFLGCVESCVESFATSVTQILGNTFYDGNYVEGKALISANETAKLIIDDNVFQYQGSSTVISIASRGPVEIIRNQIDGSDIAIEVLDGSSAQILENRFDGAGIAVVIGAGADPLVKGNDIYGDCGLGLRYDSGAKGGVQDNDIRNCLVGGIEILEAADVMVTGNRIDGIRDGKFGIWVGKQTTGRVAFNDLRGNDTALGALNWADKEPKVVMTGNKY